MKKNKKQEQKKSSSKNENSYSSNTWIGMLLLILSVTAVVFSASNSNNFVNWDDDVSVYKNSSIKDLSLKSISVYFSSFYSGMYQPLTTMSYAVIYKISGLDPHAFHMANLLFHLLNAALVFFIFKSLNINYWVVAFITIFFSIHPLHVESVAWITEHKDVLYSFFLFAGLLSYIYYVKSGFKFMRYLMTLVLFLCSLFSKSAAVIFPLLLFAVDYYMNIKISRNRILEKVPLLAISLVFGIVNLVAQQAAGSTAVTVSISIAERFLYACYSLLLYVFKFFIPVNLSNIYPYSDVPASLLWISAGIVLASAVIFYKYFRTGRDIVFGLAFFIVNVILVINIIPIGQSYFAERYSYVAYLGLLFIAGQLVHNNSQKFYRYKTQLWILTTAVLIFFSYTSYSRTKVWKDSESLWRDAIIKHPDYFYGYYGLGNALREKKSNLEAVKAYSKAIQLNPQNAAAYNDRGVANDYSGNYTEALKDYSAAINIDPGLEKAYLNRAIVNSIVKNYDAALIDFNSAISINSTNHLNYFNRGIYYLELNKITEACADWEKAKLLGSEMADEMIGKHCGR